MPRQPGLVALALVAITGSSVLAEERCTGTLCDLYYGGPPPAADATAQPAAPTPLMVPKGGVPGLFSGGGTQDASPGATGQTPKTRPLVGVGGGGLAAMVRGDQQERCSGTLCDLYYGGPAPEPQPGHPAGTPVPQPAEASVDTEVEAAPRNIRVRREPARAQPARCVATGRDLWACYR